MSIIGDISIKAIDGNVKVLWKDLQNHFSIEYFPYFEYLFLCFVPKSFKGFVIDHSDIIADQQDDEKDSFWHLDPEKVEKIIKDLRIFQNKIKDTFTFSIHWTGDKPQNRQSMSFNEFTKVLRTKKIDTNTEYVVNI